MNLRLQSLRTTAHLSASQLKTFVMCPRKYFLAYVERVQPGFRPVAFAFGTAWHDAIGAWLSSLGTGAMSTAQLEAHLRDELHAQIHGDGPPVLFDHDEDEGTLADKAIAMLGAFLAAAPPPERVLDVERAFSLDLTDPDTGQVLPLPLIGAMDAVVVEGGETVIWELKTAARRWGADQLAYDMQPTVYQLAARELGHRDAAVKLLVTTKAAKPAVQVERLSRGPGDERDLVATAKSLLNAVAAGVDHPARGWQCKGCQYAGACR